MIHPGRYHHLGEILDDAFLQYPSDDACIEVDRDRERARLTYAQVRAQVRRVAGWLAGRGVGADDRVAIVMSNQHAWLVAASAVLRLGGVLVPLDARLTAPELDALLAHARVRALVSEPHIVRGLSSQPEVTVVVGDATAPDGTTAWSEVCDHPGDAPLATRTRADLAAIVYSSGTGGDPKGCLLSHGAYLSQYGALAETFAWQRGDRYFSILPTNHAIDFMCGFIATWCTGGTVIHQRTLRPEFLMSTMRRYRPTQMAVVPLILEAFRRAIDERLDAQPPERRRIVDTLTGLNRALTRKAPRHGVSRWLLKPVHDAFGGQLRTIFCGGAFTDRALAEFFADLGMPVAIGYGLTEATTVVTVNDLRPMRGDSVGAPVPGVDVRVVDAGPDGVGEVQVRGPTLFDGYLDDPEQTAQAFDGEWLRTGDLGWLDGAHHLHLVGRSKNMIVTAGGKNVYPEDIEHAFHGTDADELCILAEDFVWPRAELGDEGLVLVVRAPGDKASALADDIRRRNRRLPDFKRVRSVLWWSDEFPRTASLKVRRGELAAQIRTRTERSSAEGLA